MIRINLLKKEKAKRKPAIRRIIQYALGLTLGAQLVLGSYVFSYLRSLRSLYRPASYVSCQPKTPEPGKSFEPSQFSLGNTGDNGFSLAIFKPKTLDDYLEKEKAVDARPEVLDQLELEKGEYVLLVNKETQTARLYKLDYVLVDEARVSTGRNPGNKERSGDHKTPEGMFEVVSVEQSSGWLHNGRLAYGPYFTRLNAGSWDAYGNHNPFASSPIAMHGTDEEEKLGSPASEGCIRFGNNIIREYVENGYIKKGVKIVIVDNKEKAQGGGYDVGTGEADNQEQWKDEQEP